MLPNLTERFGDLLKGMFGEIRNPDGSPLYSTPRLDTLQRLFNEMGERDATFRSMQGPIPMSLKMQRILSEDTQFIVSPQRATGFGGTTLVNVPNNTYQVVDFTFTRGLINDQSLERYGCVKYVLGYTDRFTKQDWVPAFYPVIFWGDFGFAASSTGTREVYIEFFDKADVSLGGYYFTANPPASDWATIPFIFMDWFDDGDYCKFEVYQNSGNPLAVESANFGFMLG